MRPMIWKSLLIVATPYIGCPPVRQQWAWHGGGDAMALNRVPPNTLYECHMKFSVAEFSFSGYRKIHSEAARSWKQGRERQKERGNKKRARESVRVSKSERTNWVGAKSEERYKSTDMSLCTRWRVQCVMSVGQEKSQQIHTHTHTHTRTHTHTHTHILYVWHDWFIELCHTCA